MLLQGGVDTGVQGGEIHLVEGAPCPLGGEMDRMDHYVPGGAVMGEVGGQGSTHNVGDVGGQNLAHLLGV